MPETVSPHDFQPLRPWDKRAHGRCKACVVPKLAHPTYFWAPARSLNDKSKPVCAGTKREGR